MHPIPLTLLLLLTLAVSAPTFTQAQTEDPGQSTAQTGDMTGTGLVILDAEGVDPDQYLWTNRVLVVFADTPADPRYIQQMQLLNERPRDLIEREVVVVTDTDPSAKTTVRQKLRPRGFALVLIDKDGIVKLRKPSPWATREIGRSIDKTPLRRDEIRERSRSDSPGG